MKHIYKKLRKSYICWVTCSSQSTTAWACLSSFSLANSLSTIRFSEVCKTTAAKPSLHVSIASSVLDRRSWYNLPIMRQVFFSFDKLAVILKKGKKLWNWTSPLNSVCKNRHVDNYLITKQNYNLFKVIPNLITNSSFKLTLSIILCANAPFLDLRALTWSETRSSNSATWSRASRPVDSTQIVDRKSTNKFSEDCNRG